VHLSLACIGGPSSISAPSHVAGRHLAVRREERTLPFRIEQDWLEAVIYLYPDIARAEAGEQVGGSGFLLGWRLPDSTDVTLWAVTNRHVIEQGNWTLRLNAVPDGINCVDTSDQEWYFSDTSDLAVRPLSISNELHRFKFLTDSWLLSREWFEALDIGPGDECITLGRFVGHEGKSANTPAARFGQISQSPIEPVVVGGKRQECFLVESRSIGGTSGSPVFVHLDPSYYRPSINGKTAPDGSVLGQGHFPAKPWLLGICFSMVPIWQSVCDNTFIQLQNGHQVQINTGMMGVIPAWHLIELMTSGAGGQARLALEAAIKAYLDSVPLTAS
jgi:hypothetical protein